MQVFPNSQLFGDGKEMEALLLGDVQIIAPSLAKFGKVHAQTADFDLPFLFDDIQAVDRFQASPEGQGLLTSMSKKGIMGLGYLQRHEAALGQHQAAAAAGRQGPEVPHPGVGCAGSPVQGRGRQSTEDFFLRGVPGPADRCGRWHREPWSNTYSKKFHEVQKYIMDSDHGVLDYMVITNAKWWAGLPPDVQRA